MIFPLHMPDGSNVFRFGPFELDPSKSRLFRGAARVPLSQHRDEAAQNAAQFQKRAGV